MLNISALRFDLASLSVYRTTDPILSALGQALTAIDTTEDPHKAVQAYCDFVSILYNRASGDLKAYINRFLRYADNAFARACCARKPLPTHIEQAARGDIAALARIAALTSDELIQALQARFPTQAEVFANLPAFGSDTVLMAADDAAAAYRDNGFGEFARCKAFTFERISGGYKLNPIANPDPIRLSDLKQYEVQRGQIVNNTLAFLNGKPYNNVLLYGDRGTGKSSTVKALLNEYGDAGLRIVQVDKQSLYGLAELTERLVDVPLKFILFIDDLTFNENDESFGMLKAVLEGGIVKRPDNIAIYATSNRRHLIKESFTARTGDEVHAADTRDENMSLSDRFGLAVTFAAPRKDKFLEIVRLIANDRGLVIEDEELFFGAEQFATRKGGRSPRLAKQYVDYLESMR